MKTMPILAATVSLVAPFPTAAGATPLADLAAAIGAPEARSAIGGIAVGAEVQGPDSRFTAELVSLADGRARFVQRLAGGVRETVVDADGVAHVRERPGGPFERGGPELVGRVRGHEVHRMLLDLERRFRPAGGPAADGCLGLAGTDGRPAAVCPGAAGEPPARIDLGVESAAGGARVAIELADWSLELGVRLPRTATFVDGGRRWVYRYAEPLAFRAAPGVELPRDPEGLAARLADLGELAAAHRRVIEAHRQSDPELLVASKAERSTVSGRGELSEATRDEMRERIATYFAATRFSRYDDVVVPVVAVSRDGSMGWVACQIEAEGVQRDAAGVEAPLAYGFTWVELYARVGADWSTVGNASSPKP